MGVLEQTIPYTYATSAWKDRLTSYNGESIVYDSLGNPTTYRGHTLVWGKIKQLEVFDTNTFAYNAEGIRVHKNNITYELDGTKILREVRPDGVIEYYYGNNGIVGFKYNNVEYYYQKNQQGDIVAVYTASGTKVAEYVYDAWGKCTVVLDTNGIGTLNPFRYRRYYYDVETGLYYLQSRYYDPEVGRFINADDINNIASNDSILSFNIYTYCLNSPILLMDSLGRFAISSLVIAFVVGAAVSFTTKLISNFVEGKKLDDGIWASTLIGGLSSLLNVVIPGSSVIIGAVAGAVESIIDSISDKDTTFQEAAIDVIVSASLEAISASWGGSMKSVDIVDDCFNAVKRAFKGKGLGTVWNKIKKFVASFCKDLWESFWETMAMNGLESGTSWYLDKTATYYVESLS